MRHLYEDAAYAPDWPDSHWVQGKALPDLPPATGALRADVAVIGAGYAGLNAALALARDHGRTVIALDAAQPGWGASGRNGGFCCLGGAKLSAAAIRRRTGEAGLAAWQRFERAAIDHVAGLLDTRGIDARQGPEGEALIAHSPAAYRVLERQAAPGTRLIPAAALADHGLAGPGFHGAALSPHGFPLDPMAYLLGLLAATQAAGVRVAGRSPVAAMRPVAGGWRLDLPGAEVTAAQVLVATNGYSDETLPGWIGGRILPVLSTLLVTRPLTAAERTAGFASPLMSYDTRELLHYFRHLPDGRFLFGMRGGLSAGPAAMAATHARARSRFRALFPAWAGVTVDREWSGLACLTGSLAPHVGPVPGAEGLFAAFGWHGNGVAAGSYGGAQAARLMAGAPADLPALLRQPPRRLPLPRLRRLGLRLAYAVYGVTDGPLPPDPGPA